MQKNKNPIEIFINNKKEVFGKVYYSRGFFNNASHFLNLFEYIFGEFKNGYLTKRLKIFRKYDIKCNFFVDKDAESGTINTVE